MSCTSIWLAILQILAGGPQMISMLDWNALQPNDQTWKAAGGIPGMWLLMHACLRSTPYAQPCPARSNKWLQVHPFIQSDLDSRLLFRALRDSSPWEQCQGGILEKHRVKNADRAKNGLKPLVSTATPQAEAALPWHAVAGACIVQEEPSATVTRLLLHAQSARPQRQLQQICSMHCQ